MKLCPCHSQKPYEQCCAPYHKGKAAESALLLMRSRYSAYALGLIDYIIQTMSPDLLLKRSEQQMRQFSQQTSFDGLRIEEFVDGETKASVTFTAILKQAGHDVSYTEKSLFEKSNGRWIYTSGSIV